MAGGRGNSDRPLCRTMLRGEDESAGEDAPQDQHKRQQRHRDGAPRPPHPRNWLRRGWRHVIEWLCWRQWEESTGWSAPRGSTAPFSTHGSGDQPAPGICTGIEG